MRSWTLAPTSSKIQKRTLVTMALQQKTKRIHLKNPSSNISTPRPRDHVRHVARCMAIRLEHGTPSERDLRSVASEDEELQRGVGAWFVEEDEQ